MAVEDIAADYTAKQLEAFGAFGLVVLLLIAAIWWILRHAERQRTTFNQIIENKDKEIEKWSDRTIDEIKANADAKAQMATQIIEAIAVVERLAGKRA